jgi:hypothetical protein
MLFTLTPSTAATIAKRIIDELHNDEPHTGGRWELELIDTMELAKGELVWDVKLNGRLVGKVREPS